MTKSAESFDIVQALRLVDTAVADYPKAGLFELQQEGYDTVFEQLIACMISIRTKDEVMLPVSRQLFAHARTPAEMVALTPAQIDQHIEKCAFHSRKAEQIHTIAQRAVDEFDNALPCDRDILLSLPGVGPKCANLVLGIVCDQPRIGVDIHVHRITNRWGYVNTNTAEQTLAVLEKKLPRAYWVEINRLLVPFGKFICTGRKPKCATCVLRDPCPKVGVSEKERK